MADDQATKERFETAKVIYQASVSAIASFKVSQWKVTNYGLLAYAGIAGEQIMCALSASGNT